MTAWVTVSPRYASASRLSFISVRALISCGVYFLPSMSIALPVGAHVALDAADGAIGVGDGLALGHLAHEHLAGLGERDHRRGGAAALGVGDDDRVAGLEDGDDGVGGAEVDTDCLGHLEPPGAAIGPRTVLNVRASLPADSGGPTHLWCSASIHLECLAINFPERRTQLGRVRPS
jgi:hypothetical protein